MCVCVFIVFVCLYFYVSIYFVILTSEVCSVTVKKKKKLNGSQMGIDH